METTTSTSLVPVIANAAVAVSSNITGLVAKSKAGSIIQHGQIELLKSQTEKVLAEAKAYHISDIIIITLEQMARIQRLIDDLVKRGELHDRSLSIAMDQLDNLNDILKKNLKTYESRIY